ncbi:MAG: 5'-3' exonuclease H3TH domain-containing protein, partial [Pseudomonadota bacterium]
MNKGDHLFLVDGSAYIFRAYHALPPLTRKSDGLPIGAVSGFCNMLWKLLQEARDTSVGVVPTHFAVIFDHSSTTFRNEIYPEYKANRDAPPEDLRPQFAVIREATRAFDVPCIEKEGYEADDLIATYARLAVEAGGEVTIISSDKDLMQLVGPQVTMYDTMKDRRVGVDEVVEKFGVQPDKMIDLQALAGDSTDNIPGVPGIGPKTAAQLLEEFGTLETLLERAGEIKQNKRRENLIEFADLARISKRLVTLDQQTPLDVALNELELTSLDGPKLIAFLKGLELNTLTRRVATQTEVDAANIDAASVGPADSQRGPDFDGPADNAGEAGSGDGLIETKTPAGLAAQRLAAHAALPVSHDRYETIRTLEDLERWVADGMELGLVAVDTETTSLDAMQADLVGVSLAIKPGQACYIPLAHVDGDGDLLGGGALLDGQIPIDAALQVLKPLLEAPSVLKIAQNIKYDWVVLNRYGIKTAPFDDTMLLSYALDAGRA